MKIEIADQHGDTRSSNMVNTEGDDHVPYYNRSYSTSAPYWTSNVQEIKAGKNHVAIHEINVNELVHLKTCDAPNRVGLLFLEKGNIQVKQADNSYRNIGNLQHNLVYNSQHTEETSFPARQQLRLTMINFVPEYFFTLAEGGSTFIDTMAGNIYKGNRHVFATDNNLKITYPMLRLLHSFDTSVYNMAAQRLSTEAKLLELLSLQIAQIADNSGNAILSKLSESDIKKLNLAREFILEDIAYTPSLDEIALAAGINVYKLKTGFKALFGHSVFSYLREARLEMAYKEILKRGPSLTEIAYLTGFSSIGHFSDTFKKHYGVSPSQVR